MELAPPVGRVYFPLDEELGLLPGNLAPRQHEHLVHLAGWMPFCWTVRMDAFQNCIVRYYVASQKFKTYPISHILCLSISLVAIAC